MILLLIWEQSLIAQFNLVTGFHIHKQITKMKVIFTLIISIVLCITVSSDLNSQTQARTLSLDEVTTSGQYIARDWIEMQRGFSFTASSPTTMVPKKAKLIWFLANKTLGWKPYLNLNTEQVVGSAITGEINIYTLYATVLDLSNELQEIFTTSAGWAYNVNYNTSNN